MQKIITQIEKEIKKELLPKLKLFKSFKIVKIYKKKDYLGYYKSGSYKKPVIKLNITQIYEACQEFNVDLETAIYTTILHELGHAIQDLKNYPLDELEAEEFAYFYHTFGEIMEI